MSSDESENEESECRQGVNRLSERSKELYFRAYEEFMKWKESNCSVEPFSENIFMDYFREMAKSRKPTTLWSIYSMLKATISLKHDIHMSTCKNLLIFLKSISKGHQSKKSKTLTFQNIDRFLTEAPDYSYLALKVAMIFGVDGACRGNELLNISVEDIQKHSDRLLLVTLNSTKSKRSFVVCNERVKYVEKYMALRPADVKTNRFFLHYLNGKCTRQVIGKNKIGSMPREIASYLKLPNPELYTGHCFRRTSAALSIMTDPNRKPLENELTREVFIEDPLRHDIKMEVVTCAVDPWTSSVLRPSTSQEADLDECRTSPVPTEISMLNHSVVIKRETESDSEVITDSQENKYTEGVLDIKKENNSELIVVASLIDKLPNLGGMARTSEVFGVKTYVVDSLRHLQDKQFQSLSVSAERWIDVEEVRPGQALKQYLIAKKSEGYCVVAAEQTSTSVKLQNFQFPMKTLLLLGHEKEGIPCDLLPIMDYCVEIPQQGFVRSLNVHVTAAIFIWEYARQNIL